MAEIRILDAHVANLIAAGEVVERPASVAKELVENALDAGASSITVEITHGGMTFLRVTDDGCGIPGAQLPTAFLRHATSKLSTEQDLEAIHTLGFRGEALAAICAVARVEVMSRTPGEALGWAMALEEGQPQELQEVGCPLGTTMVVRRLFAHTPARLKFLKKDGAEGAAVFAAVHREALAHPEVKFRFLRDGRQELSTPGDGALEGALYSVLGRDVALGMVPVHYEQPEDGVMVWGYAALPSCCRASRTWQFYFVNGRPVKSALMTAALEEAYRNQKMVGRFPSCVLHIQVKPGMVDVNVHPAKLEVKFGQEREVFRAIHHGVERALEGQHRLSQCQLPDPREEAQRDSKGEVQSALPVILDRKPVQCVSDVTRWASQKGGHWRVLQAKPSHPPSEEGGGVSSPGPEAVDYCVDNVDKSPQEGKDSQKIPCKTRNPKLTVGQREKKEDREGDGQEKRAAEGGAVTPEEPPIRLKGMEEEEIPWRLVGEVLHTYLIVEQGDRILMIDKHAAHERMQFDRLKAEEYQPMGQTLLSPVVCQPPPEELDALLQSRALLQNLGFEFEDFGQGALLVRQIPSDLPADQLEYHLSQLAQRLMIPGEEKLEGIRDEILHTMACQSAIKGGWHTAPQELEQVAKEVVSGRVRYCPHGRPVAIQLTRGQLERQFKRS